MPGDPVDLILGEQALQADRQEFRAALHLDQPIGRQYAGFLRGLLVGEFGKSLFERRPVADLLRERYPATLELALCSTAIALMISFFFGVTAAVKKGTRMAAW